MKTNNNLFLDKELLLLKERIKEIHLYLNKFDIFIETPNWELYQTWPIIDLAMSNTTKLLRSVHSGNQEKAHFKCEFNILELQQGLNAQSLYYGLFSEPIETIKKVPEFCEEILKEFPSFDTTMGEIFYKNNMPLPEAEFIYKAILNGEFISDGILSEMSHIRNIIEDISGRLLPKNLIVEPVYYYNDKI